MFKFKSITKGITNMFRFPIDLSTKTNVTNNIEQIFQQEKQKNDINIDVLQRSIIVAIKELDNDASIEQGFRSLSASMRIYLIINTIVICAFCAIMFLNVAPSFCRALFYGIR